MGSIQVNTNDLIYQKLRKLKIQFMVTKLKKRKLEVVVARSDEKHAGLSGRS